MRTLGDWIDAYGVSHRHPINKVIHALCVPAIVFSVLGLAWAATPWLALGIAAGGIAYYARLSVPLALGMTALGALLLGCVALIAEPFWPALGVFVVAWFVQFAGHHIEGRKPSFLEDLQFLLIGPLWLLHALYRRLGWRT